MHPGYTSFWGVLNKIGEMTLEERAEEYLDKTVHTLNTGDEIEMAKVLAEFARQEIKAKLEEAAENLDKFKASESNRIATTYNTALEVAKQSITNTPLD